MDGAKGRTPNAHLRRERELRGWSQKRVAEAVDTNKFMVSRWETGPSSFALWPLLFGRSVLTPQFVQVFCAVTEIGNPV